MTLTSVSDTGPENHSQSSSTFFTQCNESFSGESKSQSPFSLGKEPIKFTIGSSGKKSNTTRKKHSQPKSVNGWFDETPTDILNQFHDNPVKESSKFHFTSTPQKSQQQPDTNPLATPSVSIDEVNFSFSNIKLSEPSGPTATPVTNVLFSDMFHSPITPLQANLFEKKTVLASSNISNPNTSSNLFGTSKDTPQKENSPLNANIQFQLGSNNSRQLKNNGGKHRTASNSKSNFTLDSSSYFTATEAEGITPTNFTTASPPSATSTAFPFTFSEAIPSSTTQNSYYTNEQQVPQNVPDNNNTPAAAFVPGVNSKQTKGKNMSRTSRHSNTSSLNKPKQQQQSESNLFGNVETTKGTSPFVSTNQEFISPSDRPFTTNQVHEPEMDEAAPQSPTFSSGSSIKKKNHSHPPQQTTSSSSNSNSNSRSPMFESHFMNPTNPATSPMKPLFGHTQNSTPLTPAEPVVANTINSAFEHLSFIQAPNAIPPHGNVDTNSTFTFNIGNGKGTSNHRLSNAKRSIPKKTKPSVSDSRSSPSPNDLFTPTKETQSQSQRINSTPCDTPKIQSSSATATVIFPVTPVLSERDRIMKAVDQHKKEAREYYTNNDYLAAYQSYTLSINIAPNDWSDRHVVLSNRSAVSFMLGLYHEVISDCQTSLKADPKNYKLYIRLCRSYLRLGDIDSSKLMLQTCKLLLPADDTSPGIVAIQGDIAKFTSLLSSVSYEYSLLENARTHCNWTKILDISLKLTQLLNEKDNMTTAADDTPLPHCCKLQECIITSYVKLKKWNQVKRCIERLIPLMSQQSMSYHQSHSLATHPVLFKGDTLSQHCDRSVSINPSEYLPLVHPSKMPAIYTKLEWKITDNNGNENKLKSLYPTIAIDTNYLVNFLMSLGPNLSQSYIQAIKHQPINYTQSSLMMSQIYLILQRLSNVIITIPKAQAIMDTSDAKRKLVEESLKWKWFEKETEILKTFIENKQLGDDYFRTNRSERAIEMYTIALETPITANIWKAIVYCNSAAAKINLGRYKAAINDCNSALNLDKSYFKPILRRAKAYMGEKNYVSAIKDYDSYLTLSVDITESVRKEVETELSAAKVKYQKFQDDAKERQRQQQQQQQNRRKYQEPFRNQNFHRKAAEDYEEYDFEDYFSSFYSQGKKPNHKYSSGNSYSFGARPSKPVITHYTTLQVSQTATREEIIQSYRKLARQYHPDKNREADAEEMFKKVSEAYQVLSDAQERSRYDLTIRL